MQVGYLLGLGDRHPSNLMLDRYRYDSHTRVVLSCQPRVSCRIRTLLPLCKHVSTLCFPLHGLCSTQTLSLPLSVRFRLCLADPPPFALRSGKIIHIDFGDCFEASMNREKFPERVPFRLTRMLVKAMEVSGIEGNFRSTCQNVMMVLRQNKDSVMAMMEVRHTRPWLIPGV